MYKFDKWNKVDDINGFSAEYWLNNNRVFITGDVILYSRVECENNYTEIVVTEKELRSSYNDFNSDIEILAKMRCDALNEKGFMNMAEAKDKIDILKAENKELKSNLQATQQAVDFIIMNNGGI